MRLAAAMSLLFFSVLLIPQALAAKAEFKVKVNITGIVIDSGDCKFIDKGAGTMVDFKDVRYDPLNGNALEGNYRYTLKSVMQCTGDIADNTQMKLSAAMTMPYEGHAVLPITYSDGTTSPNLVIRLLVGGVVQDINKAFNVKLSSGSQPLLQVELVKIGDGKSFVSGTTFSASATLEMTFI